MNYSRKLINVNSRQLFAFLEVARLQSFAKAAESVHMSASGLSMLIKELEEQVDARLFDRTTRSVTMTDAGRRLQQVAERVVHDLRTLDDAIRGSEVAVRSRLEIAATPMVSASLLPRVIRDFSAGQPSVRVRLQDVDVGTVQTRVLDAQADIGLGFFVKPAVGLVRQPFCKFRLMRISPPGAGPGGVGPSRPWSSLAQLPLIGLPPDNPVQAVIDKHLRPVAAGDGDWPSVNLLGTLIGMVRAGLGHAVVPSVALEECLHYGLNVAMLVEPAVHLDMFLVMRRGTQPKSAVTEFAAVLKRAATRLVHG